MPFEKFYDAGAGGYDQSFGRVSQDLVPGLLKAGRVASGQRVLDVATGTGIVAEAVADVVGSSGHITATDISPPMLDHARKRLGKLPNASVAIEDGQSLSFPDRSFDVVLCGMALMLFPDQAKALSEFFRVLRDGGSVAVSVNTTPERSFVTRVNTAIGRHVPSRASAAAQYFSLGDPARLMSLFEVAGFQNIETVKESRSYGFPSFGAYFNSFDSGQNAGATAAEYLALPEHVRRSIREDVRRELEGDREPGGPIEVPVEILFASGSKPRPMAA